MATADRCLLRFIAHNRPKRPALARTSAMFEQLRAEALAEGIELLRFAYAGSIEKGTGLRRYRDRECSIPGQAVDLVVELTPGQLPSYATHVRLAAVAERCFAAAGQADALDFRRDRLSWRLLPILAQRGESGYVQWRLTPERALQTLVSAHTREVRERTRASIEQVANVGFNDCVRLLKWWQAARPPESMLPSFVLERLAILAFDRLGVREGFAVTLEAWANLLVDVDPRTLLDSAGDHAPLLLDWVDRDRHALAQWFCDGAEALREAATINDERSVTELLAERMFGHALVRTLTGC
jgi:hypothetical protein